MNLEINLPLFYWGLPNEERHDGFGNIMPSPLEIVCDGDQPCDGCGQVHYTEETACQLPDHPYGDSRESQSPYQHCQCWYDCQPCHKCGDDPVVLYGPPVKEFAL